MMEAAEDVTSENRSMVAETSPGITSWVFNLEMIREIILDYVLCGAEHPSVSDIISCRLVSRSWPQSISRILHKRQEPLFRIWLKAENSILGRPYVKENGKLLDQFSTYMNGQLCLKQRIALFSIKTSQDFFNDEDNYQNLPDFLSKFGSSLIELRLTIPARLQLVQLNANTLLPKLRYFSLRVEGDSELTRMQNDDLNNLIQSVFDASGQLKSFKFRLRFHHQCWSSYLNLNKLVLPSSVTDVDMECHSLTCNNLSLLTKNPLENLKTLKLKGWQLSLNADLISTILQNVRKTLQSFHLKGLGPVTPMLNPATFHLPIMEKLQFLGIEDMFLEPANTCSSFQQFVPELNHIIWRNQAPTTFRKWTEQSWFHLVTCLTVSWFNDVSGVEDLQVSHGQMEAIHRAYPNLRKLDVTLDKRSDLSAVEVIWSKITGLTHLTIRTANSSRVQSSNVWDGLLTGIPSERVEALTASPSLWKELQDKNASSIRDLTELETLRLASLTPSRFSLMSDVAFNFAFLKMPKLSKLILSGSFFTTKPMEKKWQNIGRSIETQTGRSRDASCEMEVNRSFGPRCFIRQMVPVHSNKVYNNGRLSYVN